MDPYFRSSYADGRLKIVDASTLEEQAVIGGLGDFTGEIACIGDKVVISSSGNPAWISDAQVNVISLASRTVLSTKSIPLAGNLAVSERGEILVSTGLSDAVQGSRLGLDVLVLSPAGQLLRSRTFFLGINRSVPASGRPAYDQIQRIVYRPAQ